MVQKIISFILCSNVCKSHIGKKGGKQLLSLGSGCKNRGHVTHELMHALGFFHEHTRPDRDKFVKILWNNIKSGNHCTPINSETLILTLKYHKVPQVESLVTFGLISLFLSPLHFGGPQISGLAYFGWLKHVRHM